MYVLSTMLIDLVLVFDLIINQRKKNVNLMVPCYTVILKYRVLLILNIDLFFKLLLPQIQPLSNFWKIPSRHFYFLHV